MFKQVDGKNYLKTRSFTLKTGFIAEFFTVWWGGGIINAKLHYYITDLLTSLTGVTQNIKFMNKLLYYTNTNQKQDWAAFMSQTY